jgi:hypothetical protein
LIPGQLIVLTAQLPGSDTILAGAKIPVARVSLHFRFRLTEQNAVHGQLQAWREALQSSDLLLKAAICSVPDEEQKSRKTQTTTDTANLLLSGCATWKTLPLQAEGVAKLLLLGNTNDEEGAVVLRAPVSLSLQ